jgi:hypothetical protein
MDTSAGGGAIGLAPTDPDPIEPTADAPCGAPDQLLAGKYRLVREIGRGGWGACGRRIGSTGADRRSR